MMLDGPGGGSDEVVELAIIVVVGVVGATVGVMMSEDTIVV